MATPFTEAPSLMAATTRSPSIWYSRARQRLMTFARSWPVIGLATVCRRTKTCRTVHPSRNRTTIAIASPRRVVPSNIMPIVLSFRSDCRRAFSSDKMKGIYSTQARRSRSGQSGPDPTNFSIDLEL